MKCVVCNKEGSYFCDDCKKNINVEQLCSNMVKGENIIKENIIPNTLSVMNEILVDVPSPKKELIMIKSYVYRENSKIYYYKEIRDKLLDNYKLILNDENINEEDKHIIECALINEYSSVKDYYKAHKIAMTLLDKKLSNECVYTLMEYFIRIRMYNLVHKFYDEYNNGSALFMKYIDDCESRESHKKKEYIPTENKEKYIDFIESIGCVINEKPKKHDREPIKDEEYPKVEFIEKMDFDTFVAYDIETTGLTEKKDCIIEIGAIRVVNGRVIDSEKFIFKEFIHPYAGVCKICKEAEEKTGISIDVLKDARSVTEVFNDFADFIGDDILVGYNNKIFDSIRLRRAGRYAHRIITNKQFDLMPIAKKVLKTRNYSLEDIADKYAIVNPNAHRAYEDAITTAFVYLKLKEVSDNAK